MSFSDFVVIGRVDVFDLPGAIAVKLDDGFMLTHTKCFIQISRGRTFRLASVWCVLVEFVSHADVERPGDDRRTRSVFGWVWTGMR